MEAVAIKKSFPVKKNTPKKLYVKYSEFLINFIDSKKKEKTISIDRGID